MTKFIAPFAAVMNGPAELPEFTDEDIDYLRKHMVTAPPKVRAALEKLLPEAKQPYEIKAKDKRAEIYLYDVIGDPWDGTTAKTFSEDMKKIADATQLDIYINSPGGSVFDGIAIYNQIRRHRAEKNVHIDGLAASIASVVAMAGDTIEMASNAMMMIHDPWALAIGTAEDMRKMADTLDRTRDTIRDTYVARTGRDVADIQDMMAEETWFGAEEAVEMGFADSMADEVPIAAMSKFDLSSFKHPPALSKPGGEDAGDEPEEPFEPKRHPALVSVEAKLIKLGIGASPG